MGQMQQDHEKTHSKVLGKDFVPKKVHVAEGPIGSQTI